MVKIIKRFCFVLAIVVCAACSTPPPVLEVEPAVVEEHNEKTKDDWWGKHSVPTDLVPKGCKDARKKYENFPC